MFHKIMYTLLPLALVGLFLFGNLFGREQFRGSVAEAIQNRLTIRDVETGQMRSFLVDDSTQITLNGEPVRFAELYPEFFAVVTADFDGQIWYAHSMEVSSVYFFVAD